MGNTDSKVDFRGAVVQLTSRIQVIRLFSLHEHDRLLLHSKSNRMMNRSGINSGRIKSPVFRISLLLFLLLKFVHYVRNYHLISQYSVINLSNDYNQLPNIPVKRNEIKPQVGFEPSERQKHCRVLFFSLAINCVRLLTRLLPYIFEEPEWRGFFWSDIPTSQQPVTTNDVWENKIDSPSAHFYF